MMKFGIIIGLIMPYAVTINEAQFLIALKDQKLKTQSQYIIHGLKSVFCLAQCLIAAKECNSLNIHREKEICEVNYDSTEEAKESNMIKEQGWVYYEKTVNVYNQY